MTDKELIVSLYQRFQQAKIHCIIHRRGTFKFVISQDELKRLQAITGYDLLMASILECTDKAHSLRLRNCIKKGATSTYQVEVIKS